MLLAALPLCQRKHLESRAVEEGQLAPWSPFSRQREGSDISSPSEASLLGPSRPLLSFSGAWRSPSLPRTGEWWCSGLPVPLG